MEDHQLLAAFGKPSTLQ